MKVIALVAAVAGGVVVGCGAPSDLSEVGMSRHAVTTPLPSTGFVPYPVRTDSNGNPVLGLDGKPQPSWDGSLADLLAADSLAQCVNPESGDEGMLAPDAYLKFLKGKMGSPKCGSQVYANTTQAWLGFRGNPLCNVNTSTMVGQSAGLNRNLNEAAAYFLPQTGMPANVMAGYSTAQGELAVAQVNLCMAKVLREKMLSADILIASGRVQLELLEVIRERVQIAMLYHALVGLAVSTIDTTSFTATNGGQIFGTYRAWSGLTVPTVAFTSVQDQLKHIGRRFAESVEMHIDVTHELGELLARSASAKSDASDLTDPTSTSGTDAEVLWGPGSWRNRLYNLLYGGDPLGRGIDAPSASNRPWGGLGGFVPNASRGVGRFVSTDMERPEVGVLLGLARDADALYLKRDAFDEHGNLTVDVEAAASFIYRDVEARLLERNCLAQTPGGTCAFTVASSGVLSDNDFRSNSYSGSEIWKRHRVRPDDARKLARALAEAIPRVNQFWAIVSVPAQDAHGVFHFGGKHELLSAGGPKSPPGISMTGDEQWYHLAPDFSVLEQENAVSMSPFQSMAGFHMPLTLDVTNIGANQGFVARVSDASHFSMPGETNASLRYLGAISALVATRDAILTGTSWSKDSRAPIGSRAYYSLAGEMVRAANAAVGETAVAVRGERQSKMITGACAEWDPTGGTTFCAQLTHATAQDGSLSTSVTVTVPETLSATDLLSFNTPTPAVAAVPLSGVQTTAAQSPEFQSFAGFTRASLDGATGVTLVRTEPSDFGLQRRTYRVSWPQQGLSFFSGLVRAEYPTLILRLSDGSTPKKYINLGDGVQYVSVNWGDKSGQTSVLRADDGKYLAYGGTLGALAQRMNARIPDAWASPAFDGFGVSTTWIPPSSPELLGANAGESATEFYLRTAKDAAESATAAVKDAVNNLIAEQADAQLQQVAKERSEQIKALEQKSICGDPGTGVSATNCDFVQIPVTFDLTLPCNSSERFCSQAASLLTSTIPKTFMISEPVATRLTEAVVPGFDEFQGGSLQQALIDEWNAYKQISDFLGSFKSQVLSWGAQFESANAQLALATFTADAALKTLALACSQQAFLDAIDAGFSYSDASKVTPYVTADDTGAATSAAVSWQYDGKSWSVGAFIAQGEKCNQASINAPASDPAGFPGVVAASKAAAAVIAQAEGWAASQVGTGTQWIASLASAHAKIDGIRLAGNKAMQMANLDQALQSAGKTTTFGTFRRFHAYDMWRARALLENARRQAVAARRAIEARYVVNLSKMQGDEPFVKAPAQWADEVFDFDLDAPSSVGLSTVPGAGPDAIFPNKLVDYVGNLQSFVQGYNIRRPTAMAQGDTEVLSIAGPDVRDTITTTTSTGPVTVEVLSQEANRWLFHCPDTNTWVSHPGTGQVPIVAGIGQACGTGAPPDQARVAVHLDAWGRIDGREAAPPFDVRHNTRWQRFAVNLVGTGIRDCSQAADPNACYQESFLRFNLRHAGPSWVTNFEEQWRLLGVPMARVEAGKAIAAEEWLDPLNNSWNQSFVSAAARAELFDQPLGGEYEFEFAMTPDVRLDRIQRVQILSETKYWVRQQ